LFHHQALVVADAGELTHTFLLGRNGEATAIIEP
jgi:hypothetical protein